MVVQIFNINPRSHLQILGVRRMTWSKFRTEDQQMLGVTVQNLVAPVLRTPAYRVQKPIRDDTESNIAILFTITGRKIQDKTFIIVRTMCGFVHVG